MTRRIAFLFPGQGAQKVGMGRDLFGSYDFADKLIAHGSNIVDADLAGLCTRGPARRLEETKILQPALAALCLALWQKLVDGGIEPIVTAGHSLGELPALAASGMVDPLSVVTMAAARGRLMGEAASKASGGMISVTGLPVDEVIAQIEPFSKKGIVCAAAINAQKQVTVSGDLELVNEVAKAFARQEDVSVTRLRVSGAWHSGHMESAVGLFRFALDDIELQSPSTPMVFNRTGREASEGNEVRELIAGQLMSPVRWDLVMQRLVDLDITDFVEIGPGRVLRGLVRLNCQGSNVSVHNISDLRTLERAVQALTS